MLLAVMLLTMVLIAIIRVIASMALHHMSGHLRRATLKVDVYSAGIGFCRFLESQFSAQFLALGLDLLDMARRVVSFPYNAKTWLSIAHILLKGHFALHMQVSLPCRLGISDPLLQHLLRFFDELSVQIDSIAVHSADGIVLSEDVVGSLFIVLVHHCAMPFALFRQLMRCSAITPLIGLMRLEEL